jgi:hypothetical protein
MIMRVKNNKKSKVGRMQYQPFDSLKNEMVLAYYENLPLAHILSVPLDAEDEVNNVEHIVEVLVRKGLKSLDVSKFKNYK